MNKKLEFVKYHKEEILIGTGCLIGATAIIIFGAKGIAKCLSISKNNKELGEKILNGFLNNPEVKLSDFEKCAKLIDEEVFTDLAPQIENTMLDKNIDKLVIERTYNLVDDIKKHLTITIENA